MEGRAGVQTLTPGWERDLELRGRESTTTDQHDIPPGRAFPDAVSLNPLSNPSQNQIPLFWRRKQRMGAQGG